MQTTKPTTDMQKHPPIEELAATCQEFEGIRGRHDKMTPELLKLVGQLRRRKLSLAAIFKGLQTEKLMPYKGYQSFYKSYHRASYAGSNGNGNGHGHSKDKPKTKEKEAA